MVSSSSLQLLSFSCRVTQTLIRGHALILIDRLVVFFFFFLGLSLISYKNKKQTTISKSSSKAEYHALALATCEPQWLVYLLQEFMLPAIQPMVIYCDNQLALHGASNPVFHERQNTSRSIVILLETSCNLEFSCSFPSSLLNSLQTSSPNHWLRLPSSLFIASSVY